MRTRHFIQISDSHLSGTDATNHRALAAMVAQVNGLVDSGVPVDLVVHTGDVSDDGDADGADGGSTREAAALLSGLRVPWVLVGGNHDRRRWLDVAFDNRALGTPLGAGLSATSAGGIDCLLLDANPENGADELSGRIDDDLLAALDLALSTRLRPVVLLMHYPLVGLAVDGWMEPVIGGAALHRLLARHAARLCGVFSGHVHRASARLLDNVLYVSAPGCRRHFLHWPGGGFADQRDHTWGFNYVRLDASGTQVQFHALPLG